MGGIQQILRLQEPLTEGPLHDVHLTGVHTIAIGCLVAQEIRGMQCHQFSSRKNPSWSHRNMSKMGGVGSNPSHIPPCVSKWVENKRGGVAPSLFASNHIETDGEGLNPLLSH